MRLALLLVGTATLVALPAAAQDKNSDAGRGDGRTDCPAPAPRMVRTFSFRTRDGNRAALGLGTTSGSLRDTLGILVTDVTSGGPAEKAGIEEGDRLVSVNGTELRLSPADAGDREMQGLMSRRLVRMLEKVKPGDQVDLRVYADGKLRTVKVTTVKASELFKEESMLHLDSDWLAAPGAIEFDEGGGAFKELSKSFGKLRDLPQTFEFDAPDAPMAPTPPTPPTPPGALSAPHRFMRIITPAAPTPHPTPVAPAPAADSFSSTLSI
jgi:hypothetical protein